MKDLFDTEEKRNQAIANFRGLLDHPGYKLMQEIVNANIEFVSNQILEGIEDETKETIDRLRDKLKVYKEVINTPIDFITKLNPADVDVPNDDPFDTVESLKLERKQAIDNDTA